MSVTACAWPVSEASAFLPDMVGKKKQWRRTFLREWREHRGLSQETLAEAMGCSPSYVALLEAGNRRYNQDQLERAAHALRTSPAAILSRRPPPDGAEDIDHVWESLSPAERNRAIRVYRTLREEARH